MVASMEYDINTSKKNDYIKKKILWLVVFALLVLVILIGILSGVLAAKKAREETEAKYKKTTKGAVSTTTTTTTMTTTSTSTNPLTTKGTCIGAWCSVRLPNSITPSHYNLSITADVDALKYTGIQVIKFEVNKPTNVILVHIKQITIDASSVSDSKNQLNIKETFYYPPNEYFVVVLEEDMSVGHHKIVLHFHADVSKILTGFYNSSYKDGNIKKTLLTTKFQPTDARKAFPCFDEPDLKAFFTVTIIHPISYHARSNMPGTTTKDPAKKSMAVTTFPETVKMSTYLVCFIVSQFESKYSANTGIGNNVTLAIWSQPAFINSTKYAFDTSKEMLTYFETFLGVPYPMPKLDMFAIPDYGSGATEHWGIITYRESRLLYTPGQSSRSNQRSTAGIIAHECAHLWFGNLVTCKWWDDLWVQEGMASYLEYYAMHNSHPEWQIMDKFLIYDWKTGISLDALASSHPISQRVDHPSQIKEMFDSITYNKGSSLFQMLDYYLGVEKFKEGLNRYLITNAYKGATIADLWEAFSQVSGLNITEVMNTWTYQMGFPVITIRKNNNSSFSLTQKHFLIDPQATNLPKSMYNYQWKIPFTYATSNNLTERRSFLFGDKTAEINSTATWILGNFNHRGFYRVNYDLEGWQKISEQLRKDFKVFAVTNRAGLTDDAFQLARAGLLNYSVPLDLVNILINDTNIIVWDMVLTNLDYLDAVLSSQRIYENFKKFVVSKIRPMYLRSKDSYLSAACNYGVEEAIMDVRKHFNDWKNENKRIPPKIRSTVYYYAVANGDYEDWEFVYKKFRSSSDSSERGKLQAALGASRNIWILRKWLQKTINTTIVRSQDTAYVIARIASSNPVGKYLAWNFVDENWEAIMNIAKENNFHVARLTSGLTSQFSTDYDLKEAERLWRKYPDAGTGAQARQQGLEKIKANIYWLKQNYVTVEKWLTDNTTR